MKKYIFDEEYLPFEVQELEQEKMYSSCELLDDEESFSPYSPQHSLYHGLRFQEHLEILEGIFQSKKILAGKHLPFYDMYSDNANMGKYVSLLGLKSIFSIEYQLFIKENISLIVSPKCNAFLTKQISFHNWEKIKNSKTKNLYSYMSGEFFYKDFISFDFVKAIGVPYDYYKQTKGLKYAEFMLNEVSTLMDKYDIHLDIVDTSVDYHILIFKMKYKVKRR